MIAKGVSVVPTGSDTPISWLSAAFKTLNLPVSLTGKTYDVGLIVIYIAYLFSYTFYQVIKSISISDFGIILVEQSQNYAPLASSNNTLAKYANPFQFSLQVISSEGQLYLYSS